MKILNSSFFRALTAIAVGVLLIKFPDNTVTGIVIAIGVLFLLSGIVSVLSYIHARRQVSEYKIYDGLGRQIAGQAPVFPVVGIGSIILGGILATMPGTFVSALMYVIGGILILGAIGQYMSIITVRRYASVSFWFWICPTFILLAGIYFMVYPTEPLSMAMTLLGWLTLFYGIVETMNALVFYGYKRNWEKSQENRGLADAEEITDDDAEGAATTPSAEVTAEQPDEGMSGLPIRQ